jgi:hypothetical protein
MDPTQAVSVAVKAALFVLALGQAALPPPKTPPKPAPTAKVERGLW